MVVHAPCSPYRAVFPPSLIHFDFPGMYTGTIYIDFDLQDQGFKGEGQKYNDVIAVKTHTGFDNQRPRFQRCILILRNPFDAIWAEFNRLRTELHVGIAEPSDWESQSKSLLWRYIVGSVQERPNSSALVMELRLSCTNPSTWSAGSHSLEPQAKIGKSVEQLIRTNNKNVSKLGLLAFCRAI